MGGYSSPGGGWEVILHPVRGGRWVVGGNSSPGVGWEVILFGALNRIAERRRRPLQKLPLRRPLEEFERRW